MLIIPFIKVDEFNFSDNYNQIKEKIDCNYKEDVLEIIEKKYPRIYIEDLDLMINFNEDLESVRFFEFFKEAIELIFNQIDLKSEPKETVEKVFRSNDLDVNLHKSILESKNLGITITYSAAQASIPNRIESVLIVERDYHSEEKIDLNDLYKSITGEDYPS